MSGLSDNTIGTTSALASVALGGSIVEKHFNLDDTKKTIDSFFSLREKDFKIMVRKIRDVELAIGKVNYNISKSSRKNLNSRRSIYVSKQINKGEIISKDNIRVVRPSFGLHPKFYKKIL